MGNNNPPSTGWVERTLVPFGANGAKSNNNPPSTGWVERGELLEVVGEGTVTTTLLVQGGLKVHGDRINQYPNYCNNNPPSTGWVERLLIMDFQM